MRPSNITPDNNEKEEYKTSGFETKLLGLLSKYPASELEIVELIALSRNKLGQEKMREIVTATWKEYAPNVMLPPSFVSALNRTTAKEARSRTSGSGDLIADLEKAIHTKENQGSIPDTHDLRKNLMLEIRKEVKDEHRNIEIILNTALSAFTDNPINLAVVAKSSEGKTYLVTRTVGKFPKKDVIMLRKASPKVFTRETGKLAVRMVKGNEESYETKIENEFTGETMTVGEYKDFLTKTIENIEKYNKKKNKDKKNQEGSETDQIDIKEAKEALYNLMANMFTLVDFRNKILVFLDRPDPALWNEMLSVLSHDQEYIVTSFVEGEGLKRVRKVVFQGWPAVIFCTSKDEDFNWKDLETRFQIIEPVMTARKYTDGTNYAVENEFSIRNGGVLGSEAIEKLESLIHWLIANKPRTITPFPPMKLADAISGGTVSSGDLMRKIPRLLRHVSMNALFNVSERVILRNEEQIYVITAYKDLMRLVFLFDDLELGASLAGMGTGIFELLTQVIAPIFNEKKGQERLDSESMETIKQKQIKDRFLEYIEDCKGKRRITHMGASARTFSNYMKELEGKGFIKRVEDDNDKRGWKVIPTWSEIPQIIPIHERLKKLRKPMGIVDLPDMAYLETLNFRASYKSQKLEKTYPENIDIEKNRFPKTLAIIGFAQQHSGYVTIYSDPVFPNFANIQDDGIKTENTASGDNRENEDAQKPSVPYAFTNFSEETINNKTSKIEDSKNVGIEKSPETADEPNFSNDKNTQSDPIGPDTVLVRITEDLPVIAQPDRDYRLRKEDIVNLKPDFAGLLIKKGWGVRIPEGISQFHEENYTDVKANTKTNNKTAVLQDEQEKSDTKNGEYSHVNRPNRPNRSDSQAEPTQYAIQSESDKRSDVLDKNVYRRITNMNPIRNPNPSKFIRGSIWRMTLKEAQSLMVYEFSEPVEESEINGMEVHELGPS